MKIYSTRCPHYLLYLMIIELLFVPSFFYYVSLFTRLSNMSAPYLLHLEHQKCTCLYHFLQCD